MRAPTNKSKSSAAGSGCRARICSRVPGGSRLRPLSASPAPARAHLRRGHAAVAVETPAGPLLHCGDAYFHRSTLDDAHGPMPRGLRFFERSIAVDRERVRANHARLRSGMEALGFRSYVPAQHSSAIISTFLYPAHPRFDFQDFYRRLSARGFLIYPGKLTQAECFRLGNIGRLFESDMDALLTAIPPVLAEMGVELEQHDSALVSVTEARYLGGYRVWLRFDDGLEGEVNLDGELIGPVFEPLKDPEVFKNFAVDHTLEWPNGADFAPEFLYERVRGARADQ